MGYLTNLSFNKKDPSIMHIDLNSCFATIEQQANPKLREKPVAVAAYKTPFGCIVAPSVEAKRRGVKVGMRVKDGRRLCPNLVVLEPDPWKYRNIHIRLRKLISKYTADFNPKSIDEFVLEMEGYPSYQKGMEKLAKEIKKRIKKEIGDWMTVSVGIAPNRYLAKIASGLEKPDGLKRIDNENFLDVYKKLELMDLSGIKSANAGRLNSVGVYSVPDFYRASVKKLKAAFNSIAGYYWYLRLRGWEIDNVVFARRSYGNSYVLPRPLKKKEELSPILSKLVEKTSTRLRTAGFKAKGVHVGVSYRDGNYWHKGKRFAKALFDARDIYKKAFGILARSPYEKQVRELAVSCFKLEEKNATQLELFEDVEKKEKVVDSIDAINEKWGEFVIAQARMLSAKKHVPDRIAFGNVKELEEFVTKFN